MAWNKCYSRNSRKGITRALLMVMLLLYLCGCQTCEPGEHDRSRVAKTGSIDIRAKRIQDFRELLNSEVENGGVTQEQADEMLEQLVEFEKRRAEIEAIYGKKVVAISKGQVFVGDTLEEVESAVPSLYYAEVGE